MSVSPLLYWLMQSWPMHSQHARDSSPQQLNRVWVGSSTMFAPLLTEHEWLELQRHSLQHLQS